MSSIIVRLAILTVTVIAFARTGWVIVGFIRTLLRSRSTIVASRWGWVELLTVPEPVVLAAVTYVLAAHETPEAPRQPSTSWEPPPAPASPWAPLR